MKLSRENLLSYDPSDFCHSLDKKPIEIYMFVDPLCPECWALEPIIKKLQIEYGNYFSIRHVLSGKLATLNMSRKKTLRNDRRALGKNSKQNRNVL
ncbi:GTP pyrophosphokinase domain [Mesobacillus boroniphilus JCM 21738]|uniref:GTP pyrophosphokinase domain n=1 Tax=Mesobacillus boroniphilus JCM 21738 TaxID=1294265 RepID=W4RLY4_9BACI|nr:GTP pyrophosphokinase domain [Mesobacillus boroniphilus JCM 21738]